MPIKTYNMKFTDKEMNNRRIKDALKTFLAVKIKQQRTEKYVTISDVELMILKSHPNWVPVENYLPTRKGRLKGEVGKFQGRKVIKI